MSIFCEGRDCYSASKPYYLAILVFPSGRDAPAGRLYTRLGFNYFNQATIAAFMFAK